MNLAKAFVFLCFTAFATCLTSPTHASPTDYELHTIDTCRTGILNLIRAMDQYPNIFPQQKSELSLLKNLNDRRVVESFWQSFIDYFSTLEDFERAPIGKTGSQLDLSLPHLQVKNYALTAAYSTALKFINRIENNPALDPILNETSINSGGMKNAYKALKFKYLNVVIATKFVAFQTLSKIRNMDIPAAFAAKFANDTAFIFKAGVGSGTKLTLVNALQVIGDASSQVVFPVQRSVSSWFGNVKVKRPKTYLISDQQLQSIRPRLEPGDVLLQRREWYLSNLGIPGFWTHAALYVGSPTEREAFFTDANMKARIQSLTARSIHADASVIEAIGPGVSATRFEDSAHCDSLVVLRPKLPKDEKLKAIERAFSHLGKPYDYNFDFLTDDALVCSELVYKAYLPDTKMRGIRFRPEYVAGSMMVTPNSIVEEFSKRRLTQTEQFEMVLFLDGSEKTGRAQTSSIGEFAKSWQRPKWHIVTAN